MSEPAKKKQKTSHTAIIAEPLADKKPTKKILKLNKKGACTHNFDLSPKVLPLIQPPFSVIQPPRKRG